MYDLAIMAKIIRTPPQPQQHHTTTNNNSKEAEEITEQEGDESFTCEICIEPTTEKATHAVVTRCAHRYCVDCTIKYIKVKIEDDSEAQIKCPAPNCTRELDPVACAPLVGPATFVRWCDALCRSSLSGADACHCPYADCSELLLSDCKNKRSTNNKTNKCQCPMCKRWFCSACKKAWHEGFRCDDVVEDRADVAFGRLAQKMAWKRCPNCRHFVERSGGCRVVKCRCGIHLCYTCGKQIVGGKCNCGKLHNLCENCCSWCCCLCWIFIVCVLPWLSLIHLHKHHAHH